MASIVRSNLLRRTRIASPVFRALPAASFQTSSRRSILPPPPQVIQGSVNTPAPVPPSSPSHGSYHWDFERLVSLALVPVTIAPFAAGSLNPALDATFGALLIIHSHIGFQACVIDYFPRWQVPKSRKAAEWALRLATLGVAVGIYEFETNDVGITEAVKRIWHA